MSRMTETAEIYAGCGTERPRRGELHTFYWGDWYGQIALRRRTRELQIQMVASPRKFHSLNY